MSQYAIDLTGGADMTYNNAKNRDTDDSVSLCFAFVTISTELWTVSPFVTAHTFCASRDIRVSY